jgi:segregation and condensation protein A
VYTVKNEQFEGPLDLLLSLIEREQMDITQISLARITSSYLEMIGGMQGNSSDLADFLVVAAKLLYIKSRDLIPNMASEDEEAEIEDLETKLREYQKFKNAAKHLELVLADENRGYSRRAKNENAISFTPPSNIDSGSLFAIFQEILEKVKEDTPEKTEIVHEPKVTLEDKRVHITKHLSKTGKVSFRKILSQSSSKIEVIVTFLAILEMVKQKEVSVSQDDNFADFLIMSVK